MWLAETPPPGWRRRSFTRAATLNDDIKQQLQHISLLFDNNNRRVRLFPCGADGSGGSRARVEAPTLSQMSDDAAGGAHDGEAPSKGSTGQGGKQVHQFQKNNLLPYLEGSSLPSMVGLGSGRGLEW